MWSSLPVYFAVWFVFASWFLVPTLVPMAFVLATVYVTMQLYEIKWRHHCFLSADSTAAPITLLAFVGLAIYGYRSQIGGRMLVDFATGSLAAFFVGHIVALLVAGMFHFTGELLWKHVVRHRSG